MTEKKLLKDIKFRVLLNDWVIKHDGGEDESMYSDYTKREIVVGNHCLSNEGWYKRSLMHEIVHVLQFETGHSQNIFGNGKYDDSFDSEYIAEFMTLYSEYLMEVTNYVFNKYLEQKKGEYNGRKNSEIRE